MNRISGREGFSIPDLSGLSIVEAHDSGLKGSKFSIHGEAAGNFIVTDFEFECPHKINVFFHGGVSGNLVCIGKGAEVYGDIHIHGNDSLVVIGENIAQWSLLKVRLWGSAQVFFWGRESASNGCDVTVQGDGGGVFVADDCMFANDIFVRNSDMHPLGDLKTKAWMNAPRDVYINKHVWVCQEVLVLKGVEVCKGAVVGAKSVLSGRKYAPYSLIVGAPARVVRTGVGWDRPCSPREAVVDEMYSDWISTCIR